MNTNTAIDLMLTLIMQAQRISQVIAMARAEGRETLTTEERNLLLAEDDAARARLKAAIERS